jgi:predicted N-acyltransferase
VSSPSLVAWRRARRISALAPRGWDRLAEAHGVGLSHAYLERVEAAPGIDASYLVVGGDDAPVGALPLHVRRQRAGVKPEYDPWAQLGRPLRLGDRAEAWFPMAYAGGRANESAALLLADELDPAARHTVARTLLEAAEEERVAAGAQALALMLVRPHALAVLSPALPPHAVVMLADADLEIQIAWVSFEDYLAAQSKSRRNSIRRDLRAFGAAGYGLEQRPLREVADVAANLVCGVQARRGDPLGVERVAERFRDLGCLHGDDALAFVAQRKGQPVAVTVALRFGTRLHAWAWGCDDEHVGQPGVYGTAGYYGPVLHAIDRGLTAVVLGVGAARAKVLRGASPVPLYHVVLAAPGLAALRAATRIAEERARRAALEAEIGDVVGRLDGREWAFGQGGA